jgi:glycosyltransferase involved in cell wall biosynthesis
MKVCWFTNVPFPAASRAAGLRPHVVGGWLPSLGDALSATGEVELLVVSFVPGGSDQHLLLDGIRHELIAVEPKQFARETWFYPSLALRQKCGDLVAQFQADVLHIHGTEYSYGLLLAEGDLTRPAVISLQGLLGAQTQGEYYGRMSLLERLASSSYRDLRGPVGLIHERRTLARMARETERRILSTDAIFVGRTLFDRAYLRAVNPHARYCHCDEVLRPQFFAAERDPRKVIGHSIFAMAGGFPKKGFHCLLKAVAQLRREFPQVSVQACGLDPRVSWRGTGYPRYLHRLIGSLGLERQVVPLGELDADAVVQQLTQAQVFAFPSFADNSPNSLAEAMMVGVPIVASFAGGIPSMVRDGETALCFPAGDETMMAECIRMIFTDAELAAGLGRRARDVARQRHDPQRIAQRILEIYRMSLATESSSSRFRVADV